MCSSAVDTAHISSQSLSSVTNMDPFCGFIIFIQQARIWIILKSMNLLRFSLFPGRIHTNTHTHISPSSFSFSANCSTHAYSFTHLTPQSNFKSIPFLSHTRICIPYDRQYQLTNLQVTDKMKNSGLLVYSPFLVDIQTPKKKLDLNQMYRQCRKRRKTKEKGKTQKEHRNKRNIRHFRR